MTESLQIVKETSDETIFEVINSQSQSFMVVLTTDEDDNVIANCTCNMQVIYGIPCSHSLKTIAKILDPEQAITQF